MPRKSGLNSTQMTIMSYRWCGRTIAMIRHVFPGICIGACQSLVWSGCDGSRWRSSDADQRAIQAAEPVLSGCDQSIGGSRIGVVSDDPSNSVISGRVSCEARRRSSGGYLVGATENYAPALRHQCLGRREPKAATAAGDEVDPVAQVEIHAARTG